jgi:hypothetical protein
MTISYNVILVLSYVEYNFFVSTAQILGQPYFS